MADIHEWAQPRTIFEKYQPTTGLRPFLERLSTLLHRNPCPLVRRKGRLTDQSWAKLNWNLTLLKVNR